MFRISAFQNAEEFNEIFGKTTHGNGVVSRKKKILLAFYKSKKVWQYCRENDEFGYWLSIKDMATLKRCVLARISQEGWQSATNDYHWRLCRCGSRDFYSTKYQVDNEGICLDGTSAELGFIRYINLERNKPYKMAAGKFFNHLLTSTYFGGKVLPQQVVVWLCEQLVDEWKAFVADRCPEYELHIGTNEWDFRKIYDDDYYDDEDFGSCMVNEGFHTFYSDAVTSRAAWLEDADGNVRARCVIYDNVHDEDGKIWRLAERQYSAGCSDLLKRQLVNALIAAGEIDGYKLVGADCGSARSFVDNEGNSLRDKKFWINCDLDSGDTVSYQDSFKWYNGSEHVAYNYPESGAYEELDTTGGVWDGPSEYDEYHDEYVFETRFVYYHGREIQCDCERLDDFVEYRGDWFHEDDMIQCPECGCEFPDPSLYDWANRYAEYSDLTEEWYCDDSCRESAEDYYKENYWSYSDIDDVYIEDEDDLSTCLIWSELYQKYCVGHVITKNIPYHIKHGNLYVHNGVLVDDPSAMIDADRACEALEQVYVELQTA